MIPSEWIAQAERRISPYIRRTPLTHDSRRSLFLKWENRQITGSFKPRGAMNKVLCLEDWEKERGLVAASAGNHGQGVALAGRLSDTKVEVFASEHAVPAKVEAMRGLGAMVHFVPGGYAEAEAAGRQYAERERKVFISPYNDGQVIAGQGTLGLEILRELGEREAIRSWIVPAGGGGLISAIGTLLAGVERRPRLIGVQAEASAFTYNLFHHHTQQGVRDLPTLADGLSGALEEGSVTIPMIESCVDDFLVVSEEDIARAIAFAWYAYNERIEGSSAVALAAALGGKAERPAVLILTGGNIQPEVHDQIITQYAGEQWD